MRRLIALFIYSVVMMPSFCFAEPSITSVSGTVTNGQSVTITGTGFGANGPTVLLFDDYEGGTNGNVLALDLAPVGTYSGRNGDAGDGYDDMKYSNLNAVSGSLAARFDISAYTNNPAMVVTAPSAFDSFYISYYSLLPTGNTFPGDGYGGANWKEIWVAKDDFVNDADLCVMGNGWTWYHWFGNDPYHGTYDSPSWTYTKVAGRWDRFSWWTKGSTSTDGATYVDITNSTGTTRAWEKTSVQTLNTGDTGKRQMFFVNGYVRQTPNSYPTFDDVYIATGEYAQARVEIGDNATYASCTKMALCTTPAGTSGWGDTSISCTIRGASFSTSDTGYMFITKSDGTRSAAGYEVTFGGSGGGSTGSLRPGVSASGVTFR